MLLNVLPERYFDLSDMPYPVSQELAILSRCFREAFDASPDSIKRRVGQRYIEVLSKEGEDTVLTCETEFFRCTDLPCLDDDGRQIAKAHILSRLATDTSTDLLVALQGLPRYLVKEEVIQFVDPLIRVVLSKRSGEDKNLAIAHLQDATLFVQEQ